MSFPRGVYIVFAVITLAVVSGCASAPPVMRFHTDETTEHVWPGAPDTPRYRFVGALTGEENIHRDDESLGVGRKVFNWLVGLVAGKKIPVVLQRPQSGFTDEAGRIYVSDVSRAAVYVFDKPAGELRVWEMADRRMRFESPVGVAPGPGGEVLVADAELGFVARLDGDGEPQGRIGEDALSRPVGVAHDPERGRVYVADTRAHAVKVFSDDGRLLDTIGRRGSGPGEFNAPTYLAYREGHLYVTDTLNSRIQVFDAEGGFLREFGRRGLFVGDLPRPKGIDTDNDGNIYVVESYYDHLLVFNDKGDLLLPIGGTGSGIGEFYLPADVWTDRRGLVYVADAFNGRIMVFQYLDGA